MIIYAAYNTINKKIYIGQTINVLKSRSREHYYASNYGSNYIFHKAIRKYGIDNFMWITLYKCDDVDELNKMEIFFIERFDTMKCGYNMTSGGDSGKRVDIVGKKISDTLKEGYNSGRIKRVKHTDESKKLLSEAGKLARAKNNPTDRLEVRLKISETLKRKYASGELIHPSKKNKSL